jgi:GNAT superfamily N-acetyltransferase
MHMRTAMPEDASAIQAFVRALSPLARRRRFLAAVNELAPAVLAAMVRNDGRDGRSLVVIEGTRVIALAQHAVAPGTRTAEVALVVADAWQGRGLGRALMAAILQFAFARGLERVVGEAYDDNAPLLALTRRFGFFARRNAGERGLVRLERELSGPWPLHGDRLSGA